MAAPMAVQRTLARFSVLVFNDDCHPLHLQVHKDDYPRLVGNVEYCSSILALERLKGKENLVHSAAGCPLFVTVRAGVDLGPPMRESLPAGDPGRGQALNQHSPIDAHLTTLYCTQRFLLHYGFSVDDKVSVHSVVPFHIDRLTVGVASQEAFSLAQKTLFSTGLLVAVCQQRVLVRKGDIFLAPFSHIFSQDELFTRELFFDMTILESEPLMQGILAVHTEIMIVNQVPPLDSKGTDGHASYDANPSHISGRKGLPLRMPVFSDFAQCLLQETIIPRVSLEIDKENKKNADFIPLVRNSDCNAKTILPVKVVTTLPSWKKMEACCPSFCGVDDMYNLIGLTEQTMHKLGLYNGSLVEVQQHLPEDSANRQNKSQENSSKKTSNLKEGKGEPPSEFRIALIKVFTDDDLEEDVAYLLPSLMINIFNTISKRLPSGQLNISLQKHRSSNSEVVEERTETLSCSNSWQGVIPYATEVHVSVIYSPDYTPNENYSLLLKHHFQKPRLIKHGDIISISTIEADPEYSSEVGDWTQRRNPVVHFTVVHIQPESLASHTYRVDTQHTVLFQDGATNSFVPVVMATLLHGDNTVLPPPGQSSIVSKLVGLSVPYLVHRRSGEERVPSILITGPAGCGKSSITRAAAAGLDMHLYQMNSHELCGETSASTEARVKAMMHRATTFAPCIVLVRNIDAFGRAPDGSTEDPRTAHAFHEIIHQALAQKVKLPIIIVATTRSHKGVNSDLADGFLHQLEIQVPGEAERFDMLTELINTSNNVCPNVNIEHISQRTAGLVLGDLYALMSHARRQAHRRIVTQCLRGRECLSWTEEKDIVSAGIFITQDDFEVALDKLQGAHSDAIGAPKIPQVAWSDVGGLADVKAEILDTIQLPLQHPELLAAGLRRSGVLLYGPPGTGKTLLAKAVATECSLNFLSVKGPELINMYVGQSEENMREVFRRARSAAPCVIFFDELDSLAPNRGRSGDSGGVMDRVVSQLLAELDGMNKSQDVFVIGATNRPDLLDPALLRPGRFDKLLYLGVNNNHQGQLKIIKALTRKFSLSLGWSLEEVVYRCPDNMTGADFYALCSEAMLNAVKRKIELLENGIAVDQTNVLVDKRDFMEALDSLVPSVSHQELKHYAAIQASFLNQK